MQPNEKPGRTLTVLLEGPSGVSQVTIGLFDSERGRYVIPIEQEILSGVGAPVTSEQMAEALNVRLWAQNNAEVFTETRVS